MGDRRTAVLRGGRAAVHHRPGVEDLVHAEEEQLAVAQRGQGHGVLRDAGVDPGVRQRRLVEPRPVDLAVGALRPRPGDARRGRQHMRRQQRVVAHDVGLAEPGRREGLQHELDRAELAGAVRGEDRGLGADRGVFRVEVQRGGGHRPQPAAPVVPRHVDAVQRAQGDLVEQGAHEVVLAAEVTVDGRRIRAEAGAEIAHGDRRDAGRRQLEPRGDDELGIQSRARRESGCRLALSHRAAPPVPGPAPFGFLSSHVTNHRSSVQSTLLTSPRTVV
ncbi:hypothetical protein RL72_00073 [Microbacterium azadirachtae]|uniref:Uncharacterized protein n=1 Tax=Microbacterium azadirachtae TaxID=582680 RepID=A0A0F0LLC9_9MICO|nr:hypothetical protein RL72_00073 [Microbacterium azadirachtae]